MDNPDPNDWEGGHEAPLSYHIEMLRDVHRMDAYERAIRRLVRPGDVVLDVGAGTGILSLLAARRGAKSVHAVESMAIAELARTLAQANGLDDRITVHRADARALDPVERVDLLVSDCMGRFLVDDGMIAAIAAAGRWLKPTGVCCPSRIDLLLAPVGGVRLRGVEAFREPFYGLDLSPARAVALDYCYHGVFGPEMLLAAAEHFHRWVLPEPPAPFHRALRWRLERAGELKALLGWFSAELADGIVLDSGPGRHSHWGQYVFPVEPVAVQPGDVLTFVVRLDPSLASPEWIWTGAVRRGPELVAEFSHRSRQDVSRAGPADRSPPAPATRQEVLDINDLGSRAFGEGDLAGAAQAFARALAALPPDLDEMAPDLYENLALAYFQQGLFSPAARAFYRALDGDLQSREQSLRLVVNCHFAEGQTYDALRLRELYEKTFGPHPTSGS